MTNEKQYPYAGSGKKIPPSYGRVTAVMSDEELESELDRARRYPEAHQDPEDWLSALMAEATRRARSK